MVKLTREEKIANFKYAQKILIKRQKDRMEAFLAKSDEERNRRVQTKTRTTQDFINLMAELAGETKLQSRIGYNAFLAALAVFIEEGNTVNLPGTGKIFWERTADRLGAIFDWENPGEIDEMQETRFGFLPRTRHPGVRRGYWRIRFLPEKRYIKKAQAKLRAMEDRKKLLAELEESI